MEKLSYLYLTVNKFKEALKQAKSLDFIDEAQEAHIMSKYFHVHMEKQAALEKTNLKYKDCGARNAHGMHLHSNGLVCQGHSFDYT